MTIADLKQGDTFTLNGIKYTTKERTVHQGHKMKDIIHTQMGEILFCIFATTVIIALTVGFVCSENKELEMVKQGYIQVQGLGTSTLLWVKDTK